MPAQLASYFPAQIVGATSALPSACLLKVTPESGLDEANHYLGDKVYDGEKTQLLRWINRLKKILEGGLSFSSSSRIVSVICSILTA